MFTYLRVISARVLKSRLPGRERTMRVHQMIYVAENTIAMWAMQVALAACLLATSVAYFFESGYTHHYTYWAENSMFDQHNVSMILKVGTQYHRPCKVKLSCVYR